MAGLLNRKAYRALLLDLAKERAHKFTRVAESAFEAAEAYLRVFAREYLWKQPGKGKTIK